MSRITTTVAIFLLATAAYGQAKDDAGDGVEHREDGQDDAGELGLPGQQDADEHPQQETDGHGDQGKKEMLH